MADLDPRLSAALDAQLRAWRATLRDGARRVGWKLGVGDRERIGTGPVFGHLTTATQLASGQTHGLGGGALLTADAEVAVECVADVDPAGDVESARLAIAGFATALELVDLWPMPGEPDSIVAANVFHRAFVLGPTQPTLPPRVMARLAVNGEIRASGSAPEDFASRVLELARLLSAMGERLVAGDRVITGTIVQTRLEPGDEVAADVAGLGQVQLRITE